VVAVVLRRAKVVESVVMLVVIWGEVENTATPPVPVSSEREAERAEEAAVVVRFEEEFVNNAREAVRLARVIVEVLIVKVSEDASPMVVFPSTARSPVMVVVPEETVPVSIRLFPYISPSASISNTTDPPTANPRRFESAVADAGFIYIVLSDWFQVEEPIAHVPV